MDSSIAGHTSHMPLLDGLHALTFAAAHTRAHGARDRGDRAPARRNPALLAKELASIDVLSGGRLVVGVGLGGGSDGKNEELGLPGGSPGAPAHRGRGGDAGPLDPGSRRRYDGELLRFSDLTLLPKPVQRPHPPLWFGAGARPALRRAVRLGDGWIGSGSSSAAQFAERVGILREELEQAGRDPAGFPIAKRVYIAAEKDERLARERLTAVLDGFYDRPGVTERVAVCGRPERCAEELRVAARRRRRRAGAEPPLRPARAARGARRGAAADARLMALTIPALFDAAVAEVPDKTWLVYEDEAFTYAAGAARDRRPSRRRWPTCGVGRGDLVIATARSRPAVRVRLAGRDVPGRVLHARRPARDRGRAGRAGGSGEPSADPDATASCPRRCERTSSASGSATWTSCSPGREDVPRPGPAPEDDPAVLIPTSGTTGRSKLVTQTHRALRDGGRRASRGGWS